MGGASEGRGGGGLRASSVSLLTAMVTRWPLKGGSGELGARISEASTPGF